MKKITTKKMALTAMLACLAFVLNTFVYFPAMAPFQHFVDVLAAVLVGPWYGFAASLLCGIMRMMSGRTIQAVTGAIFGPVLGGLIYRKTKNVYLVFVGEVWNRSDRCLCFLSADEDLLWTGCSVSILLYSVLYTVSYCGSSHGCGCSSDPEEDRGAEPHAE